MVCVTVHVSMCFLAFGALLVMSSEPDADLDVLPDVDDMMSEASETVSSLAKASEKMEEAISSTQLQHQAHLDKLRAGYTSRLAEKDKANEEIGAKNARTKRETSSLEVGNKQLRTSAEALHDKNKKLRSAFTALTPKFQAAKVFLRSGVNASEVLLHSKEVQVLKDPSPPPSLENFLEAVRADGGEDQRHSLMQIGSRSTIRRASTTFDIATENTAEDMVKELSQQISQIGQAQEEGDLHLKADFIANWEARQLKTDRLLAVQMKLNETRMNYLQEQRDLFGAMEALGRVDEDLLNRMKGISTFAEGSEKYVVSRLAMVNNATGDIDSKSQSDVVESAANAKPRSGDLAWF